MRKIMAIMALCAFATVAGAAEGVLVDVDITGAECWDDVGAATNMVWEIDLAAELGLPAGTRVDVHGIAWDVTIETQGASWLSEAGMYFDDNIAPDGSGLFLRPGSGTNEAGTATFTQVDIIDLSDNGIPDIPLANGMLRLEFYEGYDDVAGEIDSNFLATSTVTLDLVAVPEPASLALLALGALALRRR